MPEGPEVATLANYLNKHFSKFIIQRFNLMEKSRYFKYGKIPKQEYFQSNSKILQVLSRGKKIIFLLETPTNQIIYLISFLGMEGHWMHESGNNTGISLDLISPDGLNTTLYYDDSRRFGIMEFVSTLEEYNHVFKDTGPDWITSKITLEEYSKAIKNKRIKNKEIGIFIMEQQYFSGIGNYLRSEILYLSKMNPYKALGTLTDSEIKRIYNQTLETMFESYKNGGLTISTYRLPNNELGRYQPRIYNLSKSVDGFNVIKEKMKDGRSIYYCIEIQPLQCAVDTYLDS